MSKIEREGDELSTKAKFKTLAFQYGIAAATVVVTLVISIAFTSYSIKLNLTILVMASVLISTWYGGKGPGLFATFVFVLVTAISKPPTPDEYVINYVFGHVSVLAVFVFMVYMISARRRTEKHINDQRSWLQGTLASINDGVIATDLKGNITFINPVAEDLTGWRRHEAVTKEVGKVFAIFDEVTGLPVETLVPMVPGQESNAGLTGQALLVNRSGNETHIENRSSLIKTSNGQIIGLVSVFHDISERRRMEEALRTSEDKFRTMADSIPQLSWMAQADGFRSWYNQRWYDYTGTTPEQVEGWGWQSVHDPDLLPRVLKKWNSAIETGKPFEMELPLRGADGKYRMFLTRAQPLRDPEGVIKQWFGTSTDVDELKHIEESLRNTQAQLNSTLSELEQRVVERTTELESANKELESFSYSVSHDLRAPLRHIDGFVRLLTKREADRLDLTSSHYFDVISVSVAKMGLLIDELLAFSRTSRQEIHSDQVDLNKLVKEALGELESSMMTRSIDWDIAPLPPVIGDPLLLGLVMTNLLSNAIKYTRGRDEARIAIGWTDNADGQVTIFVRDNGAGFEMEYADKLFGVFQRLHHEDDFEGVGIGLATVHRIITRHGGRVWAEAEPDKGATFHLTLKKAKGEIDETTKDPIGRGQRERRRVDAGSIG